MEIEYISRYNCILIKEMSARIDFLDSNSHSPWFLGCLCSEWKWDVPAITKIKRDSNIWHIMCSIKIACDFLRKHVF